MLLHCTRAMCTAGVAVVAYASLGCGDLLRHPEVLAVAKRVGRTPSQVPPWCRMAALGFGDLRLGAGG